MPGPPPTGPALLRGDLRPPPEGDIIMTELALGDVTVPIVPEDPGLCRQDEEACGDILSVKCVTCQSEKYLQVPVPVSQLLIDMPCLADPKLLDHHLALPLLAGCTIDSWCIDSLSPAACLVPW
jgi:hypothetical protein